MHWHILQWHASIILKCSRKWCFVFLTSLHICSRLSSSITHRLWAARRADQERSSAGRMASVSSEKRSKESRWILSVFLHWGRLMKKPSDTTAHTALRDADQSPTGGDGLPSSLLTWSSVASPNVIFFIFSSCVLRLHQTAPSSGLLLAFH